MAKTKVKALVIESKDSKEKDKLVTLFSLEEGKLFVYFKGVRGERAKLKAAKELFTFGEFVVEEGKTGNIVTEVSIIDTFSPLREDLDKYYEACSILDIVKKLLKEADPALFIQTLKALKATSYENAPKYYSLVKFLISVFEDAGYNLNFENCASCKAKLTGKKYLNLEYGEFVCAGCRQLTSVEVTPATTSALKILKQTDYDKLRTIKIGGQGVERALNLLTENFEWRFGCKFFVA